jgi:SulP family sulfate permease
LTLALIAFMEAISVSKAIHNRHRGEYEIDANQEMVALGMSNIVGSLFACYPTTGGFSRSAVNDQAGAKTNLAAIISAGLIALTLLFLTPLFFYLPKAILASIIMVAVFGLIDWKMPRYLWKMQRQDFFMFLVTFLTTLSLGIKEGIGMGVLLSLGFLIFRTTRPHLAVLGKLLASGEYRNKTRFQEIELREDILIVRYDAQLYFANIANFLDRVKQEVEKKGPELRLVILHSESINFIDTTALDQLKRLILELNEQGVSFYFSYVIGPVRDFLTRTGFVQEMGKECFFTHIQEAVDYYDQKPETVQNIRFHVATQSNVFEERQI